MSKAGYIAVGIAIAMVCGAVAALDLQSDADQTAEPLSLDEVLVMAKANRCGGFSDEAPSHVIPGYEAPVRVVGLARTD